MDSRLTCLQQQAVNKVGTVSLIPRPSVRYIGSRNETRNRSTESFLLVTVDCPRTTWSTPAALLLSPLLFPLLLLLPRRSWSRSLATSCTPATSPTSSYQVETTYGGLLLWNALSSPEYRHYRPLPPHLQVCSLTAENLMAENLTAPKQVKIHLHSYGIEREGHWDQARTGTCRYHVIRLIPPPLGYEVRHKKSNLGAGQGESSLVVLLWHTEADLISKRH